MNTGVGPFSLNHVFPDFKRDDADDVSDDAEDESDGADDQSDDGGFWFNDLFRGIGATKVVQDLPKINASLYESPTLSKLEFPIQEKMHIALLQSILCYRIRQRHTERKYARLRQKQNQRSARGIFSISRQE